MPVQGTWFSDDCFHRLVTPVLTRPLLSKRTSRITFVSDWWSEDECFVLQALAWCSKLWSSVPGIVTQWQCMMVGENSRATFFSSAKRISIGIFKSSRELVSMGLFSIPRELRTVLHHRGLHSQSHPGNGITMSIKKGIQHSFPEQSLSFSHEAGVIKNIFVALSWYDRWRLFSLFSCFWPSQAANNNNNNNRNNSLCFYAK